MSSMAPHRIAEQAWQMYRQAEDRMKKAENGSADEVQAIQAVSLAALTALYAEQTDTERKQR